MEGRCHSWWMMSLQSIGAFRPHEGLYVVSHPMRNKCYFKPCIAPLTLDKWPHVVLVVILSFSPIGCPLMNIQTTCVCKCFALDFGWIHMYPVKPKDETHKCLSLMIQHEGVVLSMVMDGSKEQTWGWFYHTLVDVHCHLKQTKLYSSQQNAAERGVEEFKRGSWNKMLTMQVPKCLWDNCLGWEPKYIFAVTIAQTSLMVRFSRHTCLERQLIPASFANLHCVIGSYTYFPGTVKYPEELLCLVDCLEPAINLATWYWGNCRCAGPVSYTVLKNA